METAKSTLKKIRAINRMSAGQRIKSYLRHPLSLTLALLGATAYLLLFEVWPRYLFVFAPLYVLLAAMALDRPLFARGGEKRQKA